ncbi:DNA helicase [Klebsiella phage KpLz-2_45]|uniref:DNA helicase n=1 Tax=Klebsiella phage KpLz-2_45 TaxID=2698923 RepID=UPI001F132F2D|nr:DNA helicase [Klebsiella phage KpLz-2_45]UKS72060.1 DNA helicase [Klebsiella phage KpLz-2_45]
MFNFAKAAFGMVEVEESNGKIKITAIRSKDALGEIYNTWRTSRIEQSMFTKITPYSIEFYSFFAVEFVYILDQIIAKQGRSMIAKKTLKQVKEGILTNTWMRSTQVDHDPILDRSKLSLFTKSPLRHQMEFIDHYDTVVPKWQLSGYCMAMNTGSGKTLSSLMIAEMLNVDIIIMVSLKASIYRVWEDAMQNDYKKTPEYWVQARDGSLPSGTLPKYLIYHMEAIGKLLEDSGRFTGKKIALILDESHKLNELSSQRTQDILQFCKRIQPVTTLWASATPIKAYGSEAIPMLATFDKMMTLEAMEAFKKLYGKSSKKCFDIIRHRMGNVMFKVEIVKTNPIIENVPIKLKDPDRFLLSTLKMDMKDYILERIEYWKKLEPQVKLGYYSGVDKYARTVKTKEQEAQLKQYRRFVEQISKTTDYQMVKEEMMFCNKFEKNLIEPLLRGEDLKNFRSYKSVIKYLPLKVRGECLGNVVGKRREEVTLALIAECDLPKYIKAAEKKTIIFTSYVKAVEMTENYLVSKGFKPVTVYGEGEDLTKQVKRFFDDSSINPLIATYQSLSTSVPLIAANVILAINAPFRDYIMEQAIGRIDRINQSAQTYVFKFYLETSEPNISSRTLDILTWSEEQVNQILGVKEEAVALEAWSLEAIPQYT